jgi:hypothetical protein
MGLFARYERNFPQSPADSYRPRVRGGGLQAVLGFVATPEK